MRFTVQQIKAVHAQVKTGADFPWYISEIKKLGLICYEYLVTDGATVYYGTNDYSVKSEPIYATKEIAKTPSAETLKHNIAIHQQGKTDFLTFCEQSVEAGVEKWVIDTKKMMCSYYDLAGNEMVAEPIPQGEY